MQTALQHLAETDEEEALRRVELEKAKKAMEAVFDAVAAAAEGTVLERHAAARENEKYKAREQDYFRALYAHSALKNARATDVITVDVWRSLNAARNKGQIV